MCPLIEPKLAPAGNTRGISPYQQKTASQPPALVPTPTHSVPGLPWSREVCSGLRPRIRSIAESGSMGSRHASGGAWSPGSAGHQAVRPEGPPTALRLRRAGRPFRPLPAAHARDATAGSAKTRSPTGSSQPPPASGRHPDTPIIDYGRQHCVKAGKHALTQHHRPHDRLRIGMTPSAWLSPSKIHSQAVSRPSSVGQR